MNGFDNARPTGRWIDISMAVTDGLRSNHSKPGEEVRLSHDVSPETDPSARKSVRRINARLHVGTHIDAAEHLVPGGRRLDDYPVESFTGRAWVLDMFHKVPGKMITPEDLEAADGGRVQPDDIMLLRTGWNAHYAEPDFFRDSPYFHPDAAEWFVSRKIKMLALDFVCDPLDAERQIGGVDAFKTRALASGLLIMTNADNLDLISKECVTLYAFPVRIVPSEASPTRAVVYEE